MSGGKVRGEERFAARVVERILGVEVRPLDGPGAAPRTPDFALTYPDGLTGVLEVTIVTTELDRRLSARLQRLNNRLEGPGPFAWYVAVSSDDELDWVLQYGAACMSLLEELGITDPEELPLELLPEHASLRHLAESNISLTRLAPRKSSQPRAWLHTPEITAIYDSQADVITAAVQATLDHDPNVLRHIQKLQNWPASVRLLFLLPDLEGLPGPATMELNGIDAPPRDALVLPPGIDELWLCPPFGKNLLRYDSTGWSVLPLPRA